MTSVGMLGSTRASPDPTRHNATHLYGRLHALLRHVAHQLVQQHARALVGGRGAGAGGLELLGAVQRGVLGVGSR